jgi:flavin-binding protein dodecin
MRTAGWSANVARYEMVASAARRAHRSAGPGKLLAADRQRYYRHQGATTMAENVYKIIELVGTSTESWEKAAAAAVSRASKSLRDLRVAEISELDMQLKNGKVEAYRAKVKVSFKYESER